MLYRKIKLSTFGLYLKAVSKLWLVPLLTVNVLVPACCIRMAARGQRRILLR